MSIHDRDYMRRRAHGGDPQVSSPEEKLDSLLSGVLEKHSRKLKLFTILLLIVVALAIFVAKSGG